LYNKALFQGAAVGGGRYNHARAIFSVVAGGGGLSVTDSNSVRGEASSIGGGSGNSISTEHAVIGGGQSNSISNQHAVIGGGQSNEATGLRAVIGGGYDNTASGQDATIGGGYQNLASGSSTTIPGGVANEASEFAATAMGFRAKARHIGAFVWADRTYSDFASTADNQFRLRASGGAQIFTNSGATLGAELPANQTAWVAMCDSTKKHRYGRVNTQEILDKLARLPIETWSYKADPHGIRHVGPMAQDFYSLFKVGESDTTISTLDPDGIALAAIQQLQKENEQLKKELNDLRRVVEQMAAKSQGSNSGKAASAALSANASKPTLKEIAQ
jgi:hypothetical protein